MTTQNVTLETPMGKIVIASDNGVVPHILAIYNDSILINSDENPSVFEEGFNLHLKGKDFNSSNVELGIDRPGFVRISRLEKLFVSVDMCNICQDKIVINDAISITLTDGESVALGDNGLREWVIIGANSEAVTLDLESKKFTENSEEHYFVGVDGENYAIYSKAENNKLVAKFKWLENKD